MTARLQTRDPVRLVERLGPGLITGAADDDPSGIATYSQAGAQFGANLLFVIPLTLPLMVAVQSVCARIGCVTGHGLAGAIKRVFPGWLLLALVVLLLVANTINIAADVAAMGEAAHLLAPRVGMHVYVAAFGLISVLTQVLVPYERYVKVLKWLTLALLAYVAVVFTVKAPWGEIALRLFAPHLALDRPTLTMIVAILGTTISPYLFFWQSSQEVEEMEAKIGGSGGLKDQPRGARQEIRRIRTDTIVGMAFAEAIAGFIIVTAAVTLNRHGITNIPDAAAAAKALQPLAGPFASLVFSLGIVGTGLLAVPVLAGSAAYAIAETQGWTAGLNRRVLEAREFYAIIAIATLIGVALSFSPIDPIKALVLSAVINGVAAAPIMAVTMLVASRRDIMGRFVATRTQKVLGWLATAVMGLAALGLLATGGAS